MNARTEAQIHSLIEDARFTHNAKAGCTFMVWVGADHVYLSAAFANSTPKYAKKRKMSETVEGLVVTVPIEQFSRAEGRFVAAERMNETRKAVNGGYIVYKGCEKYTAYRELREGENAAELTHLIREYLDSADQGQLTIGTPDGVVKNYSMRDVRRDVRRDVLFDQVAEEIFLADAITT